MARPLHLEFYGALYHLTARGNAHADILADNEDRRIFLELLGKEISQQRWRCYQRAIETGKVPVTLLQLLHKCKVKSWPPSLF